MTTARRSATTTRKAHDLPPAAPLQRPKRLTGGPRITPRSPSIVERKDGRHLRRMTVYLPPDMHKRLALFCVEQDRDMSDVIREALAHHLPRARALASTTAAPGCPRPHPRTRFRSAHARGARRLATPEPPKRPRAPAARRS